MIHTVWVFVSLEFDQICLLIGCPFFLSLLVYTFGASLSENFHQGKFGFRSVKIWNKLVCKIGQIQICHYWTICCLTCWFDLRAILFPNHDPLFLSIINHHLGSKLAKKFSVLTLAQTWTDLKNFRASQKKFLAAFSIYRFLFNHFCVASDSSFHSNLSYNFFHH